MIPTDRIGKILNDKMNKYLIYTSNLPFMPKNMGDVIDYAKDTPKFYLAAVENKPTLANVKAGDQIITKKGNSLYVIKALTNCLDELTPEESEYLMNLKGEYGMRNMNISSVDQIIKLETWCKSAKPLVNCKTEEKNMNSIKNLGTRLKEMLMPSPAEGVKISANGEIAVKTTSGYVSINQDNELISYPDELVLDLPVYTISKPKEQLREGDIIATSKSYAKVVKIEGNKISAIGYTGTGKVVHTIKDFLFNQTMVRVVVSLAGTLADGQMNPMMLMMMADKGGDSLLPLMMMSQQGGNMGMNPMMMALMMDKDGGSSSTVKDMLMLSMMGGGNFNLFGAAPQVAPAPAKKKAQPAKSKKAASKPAKKANKKAKEEEVK
jgi:hypothetical protein